MAKPEKNSRAQKGPPPAHFSPTWRPPASEQARYIPRYPALRRAVTAEKLMTRFTPSSTLSAGGVPFIWGELRRQDGQPAVSSSDGAHTDETLLPFEAACELGPFLLDDDRLRTTILERLAGDETVSTITGCLMDYDTVNVKFLYCASTPSGLRPFVIALSRDRGDEVHEQLQNEFIGLDVLDDALSRAPAELRLKFGCERPLALGTSPVVAQGEQYPLIATTHHTSDTIRAVPFVISQHHKLLVWLMNRHACIYDGLSDEDLKRVNRVNKVMQTINTAGEKLSMRGLTMSAHDVRDWLQKTPVYQLFKSEAADLVRAQAIVWLLLEQRQPYDISLSTCAWGGETAGDGLTLVLRGMPGGFGDIIDDDAWVEWAQQQVEYMPSVARRYPEVGEFPKPFEAFPESFFRSRLYEARALLGLNRVYTP